MVHNTNNTNRLGELLANARLEILPLAGIRDQVTDVIPTGSTLTITCSPKHGVQRTVETAEFFAARGYEVIPHLAASEIQNHRHLGEIVKRLSASGINEVFVIGGDGQAGGKAYSCAADLIDDLVTLPDRPSRIGVAGYPEGHPDIPAEDLAEALRRKSRHASYVVPQMCFDPTVLREWLATMSVLHPDLPVVLSAPGAVARRKLLEMSPRIGVGNSVRYLSKNKRAMTKLLLHRTFTPDSLLEDVMADETVSARVIGLHLFTFNQLTDTEQWRAHQHAAWQPSSRRPAKQVSADEKERSLLPGE
ncbi:MAG: 5,10-methylenetetrahydrofolate reductase [Hyphomicrobiales bacterium]|nr:MAG: 5,10-methylenetetrahydrofolate reductase [Hyphomicrobiales bacterium]